MKKIIVTAVILSLLALSVIFSACKPNEPQKTEYTLTYTAENGGYIEGNATQTVEEGLDGETVKAVPNEGYEFVKWSDGVTTAERTDKDIQLNINVTASFRSVKQEITTKLFNLNYKFGECENKITSVTFDKKDFNKIDFPTPTREHFTFGGWYLGDTQVTDINGKMLIGEEIIDNEETEIHAKWTANETFTYKILLVYVTRIDAVLQTRDQNSTIHVDYTMSDLEREFCELSTDRLKRYLDDMLDGLVDFQVDGYFTTDTVVTENFRTLGIGATGTINNSLLPDQIPEVQKKLSDYDSVLTIFSMDDSEYKLHNAAGAAEAKYGEVNLDSFYSSIITYQTSLQAAVDALKNGTDINLDYAGMPWFNLLKDYWFETLIHELAHTIEMRVNLYSYHDSAVTQEMWIKYHDNIFINKLYYLQEIEKNGIKVGIPYAFWKGDIANVYYQVNEDKYGGHGIVFISNYIGGENDPIGSGNFRYDVILGEKVTAIARPDPGYKFVKWSDGVETAERTDLITGDLTVTAIFEKIT